MRKLSLNYFKHIDGQELYRVHDYGTHDWYAVWDPKGWETPDADELYWKDFYDSKLHKKISEKEVFIELL